MMNRFGNVACLTAALLLFSVNARAAGSAAHVFMPTGQHLNPGDFYDSEGIPYGSRYYKTPVKNGTVSLVHKKGGAADDFLLLVSVYPTGVSGCPKISNPGFETSFQDEWLEITLKDVTFDLRDLPQHPEYQCAHTAQYPVAAIPMSGGMLKKNGTKHIRLSTSDNVSRMYDIRVRDNSVQLMPGDVSSRFPAQRVEYAKNPLKLWFYPKGTVILSVSGMSDEDNGGKPPDITQDLDKVAREHGLVPMKDMVPDFKSPLADSNSFYYVDKSGDVANAPGIENGIAFGQIVEETKLYRLNGDVPGETRLRVEAHSPSAFE